MKEAIIDILKLKMTVSSSYHEGFVKKSRFQEVAEAVSALIPSVVTIEKGGLPEELEDCLVLYDKSEKIESCYISLDNGPEWIPNTWIDQRGEVTKYIKMSDIEVLFEKDSK